LCFERGYDLGYDAGHATAAADGERIEKLETTLKNERERREELEVAAASLYLGHDEGKQWFDEYRAVYLNRGPLAKAVLSTAPEGEREDVCECGHPSTDHYTTVDRSGCQYLFLPTKLCDCPRFNPVNDSQGHLPDAA